MKRIDCTALVAFMLAALVLEVRAAVPISPELQQAGEAERIRQIQMQAELSLHEKIQVGKERYQERQAFRQALVESMRTGAQERREEINGSGPNVPKVENSFDSTDIILGLLVVAAGYHVFRYFQSHEFGNEALVPAPVAGQNSAGPLPNQTPNPEDDWKQIVAATHLGSETYGGLNLDGREDLRQKLGEISSVKLCLDVSRTLMLAVSETRIKAHLQSILTGYGIRVDEKSDVLLALVVQGDFNERNLTFTHKEKLALLQNNSIIKGLIPRLKPVILWGVEHTGFARDLEMENDVLTVVDVITEMFIKERLTAPELEEVIEPAACPPVAC